MSDPIYLTIGNAREPIDIILPTDSEEISIDIEDGTTNYNLLRGKPKINGVTVIGEKTGPEYGLQNTIGDITPQDIDQMIYGG